jgi:hypothetical protein
MIYFDSDMSKSTNTVVYFDWKTVIYIYVCGKCRTQFMLPMEKSVTFTSTCAEIILNGYLARLLTKRKKEVMLETILTCKVLILHIFSSSYNVNGLW